MIEKDACRNEGREQTCLTHGRLNRHNDARDNTDKTVANGNHSPDDNVETSDTQDRIAPIDNRRRSEIDK